MLEEILTVSTIDAEIKEVFIAKNNYAGINL